MKPEHKMTLQFPFNNSKPFEILGDIKYMSCTYTNKKLSFSKEIDFKIKVKNLDI
jgi:hypothetical protein